MRAERIWLLCYDTGSAPEDWRFGLHSTLCSTEGAYMSEELAERAKEQRIAKDCTLDPKGFFIESCYLWGYDA